MDKIIQYNDSYIKTFKELREFLSSINPKYVIKYDDVFLNTKPDQKINMTHYDYLKFHEIKLTDNGDSFTDEQSLCCVDIDATLKYNNINYKYKDGIWIISNMIDIESLLPHRISMVICLKCYKRWIAIRPDKTRLIDMECENCGQGYVIETGEYIKE